MHSVPRFFILLLATGTWAASEVVIHEVHYDPADETSAEEFIELHNTGSSTVDLSGWTLAEAVDFTFPAGTGIPAGGYLVVAEDPATLTSIHGVSSEGPWEKGLNNDGETIELLDALGAEIDRVDYQSGFPWPTGARGGGGSMELVHPALDNDLGGSWRTSGSPPVPPQAVTYVPPGSTSWRFRKGTSEASNPVDAWRAPTFTEDGSWQSGQTPIGYGDGDDTTILGDMRDNYSTVYFRHSFTVDAQDIPATLRLRVYIDDGAVVWINGTEVARISAGPGQIPYNGFGNNHEATWEEVDLPNAASLLNGGANVIAVHGLNGTLGSSDFSFDLELGTPEPGAVAGQPTPGAPNSSYSAEAPPQIRQIDHSPESPVSGTPVVITAKITDPEGVASAALHYQTVDPGNYIRRDDAAYDTGWTAVPMADDGLGDDVIAGDDTYTATLPGTVQNHRRLVRYRIETEDGNGNALTVPYADDEQPNFAYFVYDGTPSWSGSFTPGGPTETFPGDLMDDMPVYQVIADGGDVTNSQYNSGFDGVHMLGTLVYDGEVYDHIEFENRGEASTYVSGKNKWRFHFNRARRLQARDDREEKYDSTWTTLNLNACASPWAAVNRGMAGLDESVSFRIYDLAGLPSSRTHYLSLRVIDEVAESNPSDQYGSDLWGLYLAVEQPNGSFLDDRDLGDGNVYKIENGGAGDKKEQGDTQSTDSSDWDAFHAASNSALTEQWWRDNMDMPAYYTLRALNRLTGNVDIRFGWNHYFYHEPTEDRWVPMPWDLDMMYIAETHQAGVIRQQNSILNHPRLRLEFRNRCREISDLVASDASPAGGQIGQLVDEYAQIVNPAGQARTWADIDAFMWNHHPRTAGDPNNHSGQSNHKGNFFRTPYLDSRFGGRYVRTLVSEDHEGFVKHIVDYMTDTFPGGAWSPGNGVPAGYGYEYLNDEAYDPAIPDTPSLDYIGDPGFPTTGLSFESTGFSDPDGSATFGRIRWRLAEIAAPGVGAFEEGDARKYEIETLYEAESDTFLAKHDLPASAVAPGHTYRVRVQHEDSSGRTSHWSNPVEFTPQQGPDATLLAEHLVISEVMYHPADPTGDELLVATDDNDFEFLELTNTSDAIALDLAAVSITDGIEFDFGAGAITVLGPGESLVIVKNPAAFEARYGGGLPVAGEYEANLSNGGERLTLSFAITTPVIDLTYDDALPWPEDSDGDGPSMQLLDPFSVPNHALPESWTAGPATPGSAGADPFDDWLADQGATNPDAEPIPGMSWLSIYALGADLAPTLREALPEAVFVDDAGTARLALEYRRRADATQVTYIVETSTDLETWHSGEGVVESFGEPVDNGDGTFTDTVRVVSQPAADTHRFLRLRVVLD